MTDASHSLGNDFRNDAAVTGAIDTIIEAMQAKQADLTGVRGPRSEEAKLAFEQVMETASEVRGRGLIYPYIGSGLGKGPLVELMDGSVKYDMITGIGVNFFGHNDPEMVRTQLNAATSDVVLQGNLLLNEEGIGFAKTLVDLASENSGIKHAFLCTGGALANENALKICFHKNQPASRVLAFQDCFMGRTWAMAQIGDSAGGRQGLPLNVLVDYMPFYDHIAARRMSAGDVSGETRFIDMAVMHLEQYIARYPQQHACFIFELVQGEGGFKVPPVAFHKALMEVCKANNIAVWDDEVQTFGRTESLFAFEHFGLGEYVDVVTVGKMSQVCAALMTQEYNPAGGLLSGTFLGSTAGLQVGKKTIERLSTGGYYTQKDGSEGKIAKHHATFRAGIQAIIDRHPEWFPDHHTVHEKVGGVGGMCRFTPFGGDRVAVQKTCKQLFNDGVISYYCGHDPYHVRFLPPLGVLEEADWAPVFEIVEKSLDKVSRTLRKKHRPGPRPMQNPYS